MGKLTFIVATVVHLLFAGSAWAVRCESVFAISTSAAAPVRAYEASKTLSQKIRDNAPHYWHFVRENGASYFNDKLIRHQGLVVGDTHPGNFIVSRLSGKMQFFIADIKDVGKAPFIFDISRLVLSTHAFLKGSVKLKETTEVLMDAYKQGLSGLSYRIPKSMRWIFEVDLATYEKNEQKYVNKRVKNSRFIKEAGMIEDVPFQFSQPERYAKLVQDIRSSVQKSMPQAQLMDIATRPRERGGSVEMTRYWALIQHNGQFRILEFKEISEPATGEYRAQEGNQKRYDNIFHTFWQTQDPLHTLVQIEGKDFLMRPKKNDVFRVKYNNQSAKDIEFGLNLAAYDAHYLGLLHGRQMNDKDYLKQLEADPAKLRDIIRQFVKDYNANLDLTVDTASRNHE